MHNLQLDTSGLVEGMLTRSSTAYTLIMLFSAVQYVQPLIIIEVVEKLHRSM